MIQIYQLSLSPTVTISGIDYADDQTLLVNIPAQAKCLLCVIEQAARGIGLSVNPDKTLFMRFKQDGPISTLTDKLLK